MLKALVLFCCFGPCAMVASAQTGTILVERGQGDSMDSATPVPQGNERRLALRAALVALRDVSTQQEAKPTGERQLNDKERAELRQQLRQQRRQ